MNYTKPNPRVLDFDTENIPGFYWYDEKSTAILHTIACAWVDDPDDIWSCQIRWVPGEGMRLLSWEYPRFKQLVERADVVTAHNIKRHDIPLLNAYAYRSQLSRIEWPMVIDTYEDLRGLKGIPKSQEYLADLYKFDERKKQVGIYTWEQAALGNPEANAVILDRCISDVRSHIELYKRRGV